MGTFNLGNVVGILHQETAPTKTNVLWGKILNPAFPLIVEIYYWDDLATAWVPVTDPTTNYWLRPVIDNIIVTPPVSPTEGDRYLIPNSGTTGVWVGNENKVAEYKTGAWQYQTPLDGFIVSVRTEANKLYDFQGLWGAGGTWNVNDFTVPIAPGTYIPTTEKGLPLGVAELDASGELINAYIKEDELSYNPATPGNWPGTTLIKYALDHLITAVGAGLPDAPADTFTYGRKDNAWALIPGVAAAGASTNIQYNTANAFDASADFTYSDTDKYLRAGVTITHTANPTYSLIAGQDIQTIGASTGAIKWSALFGNVQRFDNAATIYNLETSLVIGSNNIARIANAATGIFGSLLWGNNNLIEPANSGDYLYSSIGGGSNISRHNYQNISGQLIDALGIGALVHGQGDAGRKLSADGSWSIQLSSNTVAQTSGHGANADNSAIMGGVDHDIPSDSPRSAIIGGNQIKGAAATPDTIYLPLLRVGQGTGVTIEQKDAETKVAVIDSTTGEIKWRDDSTLGGVTTPGGADTQVQYNDVGGFGASIEMTFASNTLRLGQSGVAHIDINNTGIFSTYGTAGGLASELNLVAGVSGTFELFDAGVSKIKFSSAASAISYFNNLGPVGFDTVTPNALVGVTFGHTGGILISGGATGTRPGTPVAGMFRYNDTLDYFEGYTTGAGWGSVGEIGEAPINGTIYGRKDAAWINTDAEYWSLKGTSILNLPATGAASLNIVDGLTSSIDITGQDTAETFDFITLDVLDTGRLSPGDANFLRFQNDGTDTFRVDTTGIISINDAETSFLNLRFTGELRFGGTGVIQSNAGNVDLKLNNPTNPVNFWYQSVLKHSIDRYGLLSDTSVVDEEDAGRAYINSTIDISTQLTGHTIDPTYDGYLQELTTTGRTSTGDANHIRLNTDTIDVFKVASDGNTTVGNKLFFGNSASSYIEYLTSTVSIIKVANVNSLYITNTSTSFGGAGYPAPIILNNGAFTWRGDNGSALYTKGVGNIALKTGGIDALEIDSSQTTIIQGKGFIAPVGLDIDRVATEGSFRLNSTNNNFEGYKTVGGWVDLEGAGGGSSVGSAGSIQLSDGAGNFVDGASITNSTTALLAISGATNAIRDALTLRSYNTAAAGAAGLGTAISFEAENASSTLVDILDIRASWFDATNASEDSIVVHRIKRAGSDLEILEYGAEHSVTGDSYFEWDLSDRSLSFLSDMVVDFKSTGHAFYVQTDKLATSSSDRLMYLYRGANSGTPSVGYGVKMAWQLDNAASAKEEVLYTGTEWDTIGAGTEDSAYVVETMVAGGSTLLEGLRVVDEGIRLSGDTTQTIKTVHLQLTQGQIQALNTTHIEVVTAPGAGKYIQIISGSLFLDHNGTTYAGGTNVFFEINNVTVLTSSSNFITGSVDRFESIAMTSQNLVASNTALKVFSGADSTGAGGTIDVYVQYVIIDTN